MVLVDLGAILAAFDRLVRAKGTCLIEVDGLDPVAWTAVELRESTFDVVAPGDHNVFKDLDAAGAFLIGASKLGFRTKIVKVNKSGSETRMTLTLPAEMVDSNQRRSPRINVSQDTPISAVVNLMGEQYQCRVFDVSHHGARLGIPKTELSGLVESLRCQVTFSLMGSTYKGPGQLRWFDSETAGVYLYEMEHINPRNSEHPWVCIVQRLTSQEITPESNQLAS